MPEQTDAGTYKWNVLLVEDDETVRRQVLEYLSGETFASRGLNINEIDLDQALNLIHERKADVVILDVYRGKAQRGSEQTGIKILDSIKRSGFVPVVLYTALPEGLEKHQDKFVRLVGKEAGGLEKLREEIANLFVLRIPQIHRAIVNHIDQSLCTYMWEFVQGHWTEFEALINKPEFLRLVVQRLALTFARQGIEQMTQEVYGVPAPEQSDDVEIAHPAEYYIKPPISQDPMLGDIRLRNDDESIVYLVVLWPSCDMVSTGNRQPKTDFVLCARASLATDEPEVRNWRSDPSNNKKKKVESLIKNMRDKTPDRYHFLPGVWDIPHLVVDFQALEHVSLTTIRGFGCVATLASPFAEAMATRFQKYIGRVGTPDLDVEAVITQMQREAGTTTGDDTGSAR